MRSLFIRTISTAAAVAVLAAPGVWAQKRPGGGVVRSGEVAIPPSPRSPFGSAVFPGTGGPTGAGIYGGSAAARPPAGRPGGGNGGGHHHGQRPVVVVPYPVYWGDAAFWNSPAQTPAEPAPVETVTERQEAPPVIINQYFSGETMKPAVREYKADELPAAAPRTEPEPRQTAAPQREEFYHLAFKDGTVQTVRGYSVVGNTISFVTPYGKVRRVTLDEFDQEMTEKLNPDR